MKTIKSKRFDSNALAVNALFGGNEDGILKSTLPMAMNAGFPTISKAADFMKEMNIERGYIRLKDVPIKTVLDMVDLREILLLSSESANGNGEAVIIRERLDIPITDWDGNPNWIHELCISGHETRVDALASRLGVDQIPRSIRGKGIHKISLYGDSIITNVYNLESRIEGNILAKLLVKSECEIVEELVVQFNRESLSQLTWMSDYLHESPGGFRSPVWIGLEFMGGIDGNCAGVNFEKFNIKHSCDWWLSKHYLSFPCSNGTWTRRLHLNSVTLSCSRGSLQLCVSVDRYAEEDPPESSVIRAVKTHLINLCLEWR